MGFSQTSSGHDDSEEDMGSGYALSFLFRCDYNGMVVDPLRRTRDRDAVHCA